MTDILVSKDDGQVVTLTLNDAPANCLTMEMMSAIKMEIDRVNQSCLLYTSPSPRDQRGSRMPSSA